MTTSMKIYVVGFMGAGKTTVGRELAARIAAPFFDLDDLVEPAPVVRLQDLDASGGVSEGTSMRRQDQSGLVGGKAAEAVQVGTQPAEGSINRLFSEIHVGHRGQVDLGPIELADGGPEHLAGLPD